MKKKTLKRREPRKVRKVRDMKVEKEDKRRKNVTPGAKMSICDEGWEEEEEEREEGCRWVGVAARD